MTRTTQGIETLIQNYQRRLQKLEEQRALRGMDTPIDVLIEIEDITEKVKMLTAELAEAKNITTLASKKTDAQDGVTQDSIETRYSQYLYHLGQNFAASIRLVGADNEYFLREHVQITYDPAPYEMPNELLLEREKILSRYKEDARLAGNQFFDGLNGRLVDFRATPKDQTEQKYLEVTLGSIGWYDYIVANHILSKLLRLNPTRISHYVNLDEVAQQGVIRNIRLTNIIETAVTLVTSDGYLIYSERSQRVSIDLGNLTSGVAENIHPAKDQQVYFDSNQNALSSKLQPPPDPFQTVLRGIEEELSLLIRERLNLGSLYLLGISFNLDEFHPSFLFMVPLPLTFKETLRLCTEYPGKDFVEGTIASVSAKRDSIDLHKILSHPNWVPSGKASLIRSVEFLEGIRHRTGYDINTIIGLLANRNVLLD